MADGAHRLFFAIVPDATALAAIERAAAELKATNAVRGRWLARDKLHLTLAFLGSFARVPDELLAHARAAGERLRAPPAAFELDHAACFRGRFQAPCVLRCSPASEPRVLELHERLWSCLAACGVEGREQRRYVPHVTIAYADRALEAPLPIAPVALSADRITLFASRPGPASYEALGEWELQPALSA